jgi:hypothetical protein
VADNEGPPAIFDWRPGGGGVSLAFLFQPLVFPWLATLVLALLRGNRSVATGWIVLPLIAIFGLAAWSGSVGEDLSWDVRPLLTSVLPSLAFGWAAALLLAFRISSARAGAFVGMLACFGFFSLLALEAVPSWRKESAGWGFPVMLQFAVFGLGSAMRLAGWCCRRRFSVGRFALWQALWLLIAWVVLVLPLGLACLIEGEGVASVLVIAGVLGGVSLVASWPFLLLCGLNRGFGERLRVMTWAGLEWERPAEGGLGATSSQEGKP